MYASTQSVPDGAVMMNVIWSSAGRAPSPSKYQFLSPAIENAGSFSEGGVGESGFGFGSAPQAARLHTTAKARVRVRALMARTLSRRESRSIKLRTGLRRCCATRRSRALLMVVFAFHEV